MISINNSPGQSVNNKQCLFVSNPNNFIVSLFKLENSSKHLARSSLSHNHVFSLTELYNIVQDENNNETETKQY